MATTTNRIGESGNKWVRFLETGLVEGGIAAVRADRIRFVRVTVEYDDTYDDGDDSDVDDDGSKSEDPEELFGIRVELPPPPNGWMN